MIDHKKLFWAKVDKTETCWNWTGAKTNRGYGRLTIAQEQMAAHRVSYEWAMGPIPDGVHVDHVCHNPACVNPDHLRIATAKQNQENRKADSNSSSGFRGVYWNKRRGDWEAKVGHRRKNIHVGFFADIESANAAVIAKRLELFTHNDSDRKLVAS